MTLQNKFKSLCKEFNVDPSKNVLENLHVDGPDGRLDLSNSDLSSEQAALLGNLLSTVTEVTCLCLNDCLLSEESLKALCLGLSLNTSVTSLELRGNNIRGPGTEQLASLLRKNKHIQTLTLEWNNMGLDAASFRQFAEAVRNNRVLTSLDLRSNQLDHQCAAVLARALAGQKTLRHLDVRWNGIGVLGGRSLVEAMQLNRSLVFCPLDGNAVPPDLLQTIACRVQSNQELQEAEKQKSTERSILTAQMQDCEQSSRRQVDDAINTLKTERASFSGVQADLTFQLGQVQEALEERKATVQLLTSKLSNTETKLAATETEKAELEKELEGCRAELSSMKTTLRQEQEHHKQALERLHSELQERTSELERRLAEERSCRVDAEKQLAEQRARADRAQDEVNRLQALVRTLRDDVQAVTDREEQRRRTELEAVHEQRRAEVAQVKEQTATAYKNLQAQLRLSDEQRTALEAQLHEAGQRLYAASRETQDELSALRMRLKQQEDDRCQALQAQIDHAHSQLALAGKEKHELESTNQRLEVKARQLELDSCSLRSEIDCLNKELEMRQREVQGAAARVRAELQTEIDKLEAAKAQHHETEAALKEARSQLARREEELEKESRRRREDVRKLRDELKRREAETLRIKEDELQRAAMLHSAFRSYFNANSASLPRRKSSGGRRLSAAEVPPPAGHENDSDLSPRRRRSSGRRVSMATMPAATESDGAEF